MAGNTISLTQTLDDRQYIEALNKHYQMLDKLERKMSGLAKESKKASDDSASGLVRGAESAVKWAASLNLVQRGFELISSSAKEAIKEAEEIGRKYDAIFRKFDTLAGLKGLESTKARGAILDIAQKNAFSAEQAVAGAQSLVSAGFSVQEATGGSLNELMYGMAAAGEREGDPGQFATSLAGYLFATGKEKNAGNMRDALQRVFSLGSTNFQLQNLPELAKEAGALGALSSQEQFAAMATLQESMPGAQAATGLRSVTLSLTAKKRNKEAQEALKNLGIDANKIDLQGESLYQALGVIGDAYGKANKDTRDSDLAKFTGTEYLSAFKSLIVNKENFSKNLKLQENIAGYEEAYEIATSGRNAAQTRIDVGLERQALANDQMDDLYLKQRRLNMQAQGYSPARIKANEIGYETARFFGASQETAGWMTGNGVGFQQTTGRGFEEIRASLDANTKEVRVNNDLMRQQNNGGKAPASPVMKQQRAP